ncbi:DoxX family protein [Acidimangrovimonas sediminis]|uniref:DoxX family protein n=1 Tax=Acidimangrovimonas sediminis TaxID=2056283 RepID=UPI000C7FF222|nr:DoxX family membrane protein [Acidimangrovimonas sediminis]
MPYDPLTLIFRWQPPARLHGAGAMSLAARLVFASVLLRFFLQSAATKIGPGGLTDGAYYQILPKMFEAAGYDAAALAWPWHVVVAAGTVAELALPLMLVTGLATRVAALGLLGFFAVMSLTDVYGHMVDGATIGLPFDADPYGKILDQRLLWAMIVAVPLWLGGGAVSLDRLIAPRLRRWGAPPARA